MLVGQHDPERVDQAAVPVQPVGHAQRRSFVSRVVDGQQLHLIAALQQVPDPLAGVQPLSASDSFAEVVEDGLSGVGIQPEHDELGMTEMWPGQPYGVGERRAGRRVVSAGKDPLDRPAVLGDDAFSPGQIAGGMGVIDVVYPWLLLLVTVGQPQDQLVDAMASAA